MWGSCVMLSHKNYGIQGKWSLVWGLGKATSKDSHAVAFLEQRWGNVRCGLGCGVRNMIFILRNLSANNKNDLRQIMATGDVVLNVLWIIMQISHGQRICKGSHSHTHTHTHVLVLVAVRIYLPWHLFRFMSVSRIMTNHLTSWHVCGTVCDILCPRTYSS